MEILFFYNMVNLCLRDNGSTALSITVIIFCLFILCFVSFFVGLFLLLCFVAGILLPEFLYKNDHPLCSFLDLFYPAPNHTLKQMSHSCSICGDDGCSRKNISSYANESSNSHIKFTVPQSVDEALEELFNMVLDHYVYSWYKEICVHDDLADDIRRLIRYVASAVGARLTKVDLSGFILREILPAVVNHADSYLEAHKCAKNSAEALVVQYMENKGTLHRAVKSRAAETEYLRDVVAAIFPHVLPPDCQESRLGKIFVEELIGRFLILEGMDLLASPDTINFLLVALTNIDGPFPAASPDPSVLLFQNFASVNTHPRNSAFRVQLSAVLKDQLLLYLFQVFLKKEGGINILQFCLAVEDFNRHILDPDLSPKQLEYLHREAKNLYHTYVAPSAIDQLNFTPDIVAQIKSIVHSEPGNIVMLRTTRPLFQAYEYAYNLLEREYMPLFLNSSAYFLHRCGERTAGGHCHRHSQRHKRTESNSSASISPFRHKPLKSQSDASSGLESLTHGFRDLSAWRVSIPGVESRLEPNGKRSFMFIVSVKRIDVPGDNPDELEWVVERRYHEFYILEAKLKEFHGEFEDAHLPPRRSFASARNIDFMQSIKQTFEEYIRKLLVKSTLRGSQLLFLFLKSKDEFIPNDLIDLSFSRFIRDVPRKLVKERGQYLDSFIASFLQTSSAFVNDNIVNCDVAEEVVPYVDEDKRLIDTMYNNNAMGLSHFPFNTNWPAGTKELQVTGITDSLLYVAIKLCGLSMNATRWFTCIRTLFGATFDALVETILRTKLKEALCPSTLVKLIHFIRDALFNHEGEFFTEQEQQQMKLELRALLENLLPGWCRRVVFYEDNYLRGSRTLADVLQHPLLNKQLSYVLLDIALQKLFPEIAPNKKAQS